MAALLAPAIGVGADPPNTRKRIQDPSNPYQTTPIDPADAGDVSKLEQEIVHIQSDQEKLKAGQLKQEEYDKAVAASKEKVADIAAKRPESAPVQTSAARVYTQAGDYPKAIEHASKAIELAPKDPFPLTTRGMAYYGSGDFAGAAADAKRALALDPSDSVAKAIYELSRDRVPGDGGSGLKNSLARAGRDVVSMPESPFASAAGAEAAARLDDDPEIARYNTEEGRRLARQIISAERAMKRRDYITAFGRANEALTTFADNPRVLAARAVSAWNLGEYRTTIADATRVMQALSGGSPIMHPMLVARAAASSELGRHSDALRDAQKAIDLFPQSGRAYLERAIAKEGLHDTPASVVEDFKRAAELDAHFTPDYERALARLMPEDAGRAASSTMSGGSPAVSALLARYGMGSGSSDAAFAVGAVALVALVAAGAYGLRRRS